LRNAEVRKGRYETSCSICWLGPRLPHDIANTAAKQTLRRLGRNVVATCPCCYHVDDGRSGTVKKRML